MGEVYGRERIQQYITGEWLGRELYYFDEIDSTSTDARRRAKSGGRQGLTVVADAQSQGKGSHGRKWESEKGGGVWMSFLLRPAFPVTQMCQVAILSSYATACAITRCTGIETGIKWPNDILIDGLKVAGILTEAEVKENAILDMVVGIGVNVNQEGFADEISRVATSLYMETGIRTERARLAGAILSCFEETYEQYLKAGSLAAVVPAYNRKLVHRDQSIGLVRGRDVEQVYSRGIDAQGRLLVADRTGAERRISAGEVSVRGSTVYTRNNKNGGKSE